MNLTIRVPPQPAQEREPSRRRPWHQGPGHPLRVVLFGDPDVAVAEQDADAIETDSILELLRWQSGLAVEDLSEQTAARV